MKTISTTEFRINCLRILDEVSESGESYLVIKHGKAVARVVRANDFAAFPQDELVGTVEFLGDVISPLVPDKDQ